MNTSSTPRLRCPDEHPLGAEPEHRPRSRPRWRPRPAGRTGTAPAPTRRRRSGWSRTARRSAAAARARARTTWTRWIAGQVLGRRRGQRAVGLADPAGGRAAAPCGRAGWPRSAAAWTAVPAAVKTGSSVTITTNMPITSAVAGSSVASTCTSMSCVYATSLVTRAVRSPTRCLPWNRSDCRCSRASTDSRRSLATCRPAADSSRVAQ